MKKVCKVGAQSFASRRCSTDNEPIFSKRISSGTKGTIVYITTVPLVGVLGDMFNGPTIRQSVRHMMWQLWVVGLCAWRLNVCIACSYITLAIEL